MNFGVAWLGRNMTHLDGAKVAHAEIREYFACRILPLGAVPGQINRLGDGVAMYVQEQIFETKKSRVANATRLDVTQLAGFRT